MLFIIIALTIYPALIYIDDQAKTFAAATKKIQLEAYKGIIKAESENNLPELLKARYDYENADKIVLNFGAEAILKVK